MAATRKPTATHPVTLRPDGMMAGGVVVFVGECGCLFVVVCFQKKTSAPFSGLLDEEDSKIFPGSKKMWLLGAALDQVKNS